MYRIHFEPKGAYWCIQFRKYMVLWVTTTEISAGKPTVKRFTSYGEAQTFVNAQGLDQAYRCATAKAYYEATSNSQEAIEATRLREIRGLIQEVLKNDLALDRPTM